jgi:K+-sensing histidine kinase KdpD
MLGLRDRNEVAMEKIRQYREHIALLAAVVLPLGVAAILVPFRSSFANTASALILVAVIVAVAALGSRVSGFVAAISATLWFDFFLTRPYEKLAITHRPDVETAVSLFVVGITVTEMAARNRHHYEWAHKESDYVSLIHDFAELSASGAPREAVIQRARTELIELLHLRACRYESESSERRANRREHDGHVLLGGNVWNVGRMGLPGPELELLVQGRGRTQGRVVLTPTPGHPVSLERRVVAVAIADQVGAAHRVQLQSA